MNAGIENCTLRSILTNPTEVPPATVESIAAFNATGSTSSDVEAALKVSVCEVTGCNLTLGGLMRYATGDGGARVQEKLESAPGCVLRASWNKPK